MLPGFKPIEFLLIVLTHTGHCLFVDSTPQLELGATANGLTVPFALTAGLSALGDTRVVIYGGFAELIAGAISMGLGGYLGAKSEIASYRETRADTELLVDSDPVSVRSDIRDVFGPYALDRAALESLVDHLSSSPISSTF
ncbi:unnamed protein product [Parascedosporium putredinis]|uniref:Uncharacterized protein n=1 Tax=Parascedosporium putredinis TaxID=1442378 RepID=A0A9P1H9L3_9PEZI|nr:unnamed protein product [Parascedosporium putredinis]CAI8003705.1 unnamed protein product [Parascedosporium putredinis]